MAELREFDYAVTFKTDPEELRRENATLRARLRAKEDECSRWAMRWAREGLGVSEAVRLSDPRERALDEEQR